MQVHKFHSYGMLRGCRLYNSRLKNSASPPSVRDAEKLCRVRKNSNILQVAVVASYSGGKMAGRRTYHLLASPQADSGTALCRSVSVVHRPRLILCLGQWWDAVPRQCLATPQAISSQLQPMPCSQNFLALELVDIRHRSDHLRVCMWGEVVN